MNAAFESMLNDMLAEIQKQRESLIRLQQGAPEISGSARSKRRQVSAVVDARGDLVELKFHGMGYRSLAPAELATIIVDTVCEARAEAQRQLWDIVGENFPDETQFAEIVNADYDWTESLSLPKPLLDLIHASLPDQAETAVFPGDLHSGHDDRQVDAEAAVRDDRDDGKSGSTR